MPTRREWLVASVIFLTKEITFSITEKDHVTFKLSR